MVTTFIKSVSTEHTGGGVMVDFVTLSNGIVISITDECLHVHAADDEEMKKPIGIISFDTQPIKLYYLEGSEAVKMLEDEGIEAVVEYYSEPENALPDFYECDFNSKQERDAFIKGLAIAGGSDNYSILEKSEYDQLNQI